MAETIKRCGRFRLVRGRTGKTYIRATGGGSMLLPPEHEMADAHIMRTWSAYHKYYTDKANEFDAPLAQVFCELAPCHYARLLAISDWLEERGDKRAEILRRELDVA